MSALIVSPFTEDLWIDGRVYRVPKEVAAHVRFLSDLNARFADRLARTAGPREIPFGRRGA